MGTIVLPAVLFSISGMFTFTFGVDRNRKVLTVIGVCAMLIFFMWFMICDRSLRALEFASKLR